ncbi:MAG TPA: chemotaxis protein CheA [Nitrosopumilaceae archaeon]|nr:chemotaxis protein CheA [Nitrosopumilaceae archaeon]
MSDNNYREMYVTEALEHVDIMNHALLKLEDEPEVKEHLDLIFRSAHTIKGMAATMGYDQTKDLCKNIENIFDGIRKKQEKLSHNLASALFKCLDALQQMINDENKKIDLESYLSMLKNPNKPQQIETEENMQPAQLPTIRVKMSDLDSLVNLVGELLISKMKLENSLKEESSVKSKTVLMDLGRLVSDLQYQSLKLRLVPIDTIFKRSERVVRDTANKLGKEVNLQMDGSKIELDRTILDAISDPLLHILRNCVDHGIENPSERKSLKKSESGNIKLSAYHVGEQIAIKIEDDGKGIDLEKVKAKAVENGIITQEEANDLSEMKIIDLLGTPGLSTAKTVTDISGRGVGMDVVINKVRDIGGNIQISTEMGKGTTMILMLPLSVSIIGGLLVNISNEKFILPLSSITTTVKINKNEIKSLHGVEVIEHQDKIVPIVRVSDILQIPENKQIKSNQVTIIIVDKGGKPYGLVVDSFEHKQEIVIKKFNNTSDLENSFRNATILPNGKVALILDPGMII